MFTQRFHDQVMNTGPQLSNRLIIAIRMDSVGQQRDNDLPFRFDPDGRTGETEMTNRVSGEITP